MWRPTNAASRQSQRPRRRRVVVSLLFFAGFGVLLARQTADERNSVLAFTDGLDSQIRSRDSLLIFGAGVLGCRVGTQWLSRHPGARVVGVTRTDASHGDLRAAGIEPVLALDVAATQPPHLFQHVLFSAPPQMGGGAGHSAYETAVAGALMNWAEQGTTSGGPPGRFVFTSSAGVFAEDSGGFVDEGSSVSDSDSSKPLLRAEALVLEAGGTVLRLAGLYDTYRGPHNYWLEAGRINGNPDGLINLVHYDDASAAVVASLEAGELVSGQTFVIADGSPMTRAGICQAALASRAFPGASAPVFESLGAHVPRGGHAGKRLSAARAGSMLGWVPRYKSFSQYMAGL